MNLEHVLNLDARQHTVALKSKQAARGFVIWFSGVSIALYLTVAIATSIYSTANFTKAAIFGMALCTVSSIISFLITEWAFDQPKEVFMSVALGMVIVRMFNLLFAFAVGLFFLKFDAIGMAAGMIINYFTYLVVEIMYVHKKGLLIGE